LCLSKEGNAVKKNILVVFLALAAQIVVGCKQEFGITDISPPVGNIGGGESVSINGSGFDPSMGFTVYFGNNKATHVAVNSSKKLTVTTPSSNKATKVDVRISTDDGKEYVLRKAFSYLTKSNMSLGDLHNRKSAREAQD
jgi:hypothetical protein